VAKPRILGGAAKGRSLATPARGTRPSPGKLRAALFNMLQFYQRGRFLDLYAGSGAVGLEAASRGWQVTCVELAKPAAEVIRRNARQLGLPVEVVTGDALRYVQAHPQAFDVVFAAPPYPDNLPGIFQALLDAEVARLYLFQHPTRLELALTRQGVPVPLKRRRYGSNALSLISFEPTS
jgi:16S rRNA (guanine(966)-N(2))-methyltransferase RsmD